MSYHSRTKRTTNRKGIGWGHIPYYDDKYPWQKPYVGNLGRSVHSLQKIERQKGKKLCDEGYEDYLDELEDAQIPVEDFEDFTNGFCYEDYFYDDDRYEEDLQMIYDDPYESMAWWYSPEDTSYSIFN